MHLHSHKLCGAHELCTRAERCDWSAGAQGVKTMLGVSLRARRHTTRVMLGLSLRARWDTTLVIISLKADTSTNAHSFSFTMITEATTLNTTLMSRPPHPPTTPRIQPPLGTSSTCLRPRDPTRPRRPAVLTHLTTRWHHHLLVTKVTFSRGYDEHNYIFSRCWFNTVLASINFGRRYFSQVHTNETN